jgi:hypothetical protein
MRSLRRFVHALVIVPLLTLAEEPVTEKACLVITEDEAGETHAVEVPSLRVLEQTASTDTFALPADAPPSVRSVMCIRSSPVPAPHDHKVLAAGYPLYILVQDGSETKRIIVLEISGGQFRIRLTQGELSADEQRDIRARLNEFQESTRSTK